MLAVVPDANLLTAARDAGVGRFLYASSVRVYDGEKQDVSRAASADDGYGWEKQFAERLCRHFHDDLGLPTRVARLHDVYGPHGAYEGGREPAPAAVCRKVVEAKLTGRHQIDIWGDGTRARPFTYVSDCVAGLRAVADADVPDPFDIGPAEPVSINHLVDLAEQIAGIKLRRNYLSDAPAAGTAARNADHAPATARQPVRWRPSVTLRDGLEQTFRWVYDDFVAHHGVCPPARPVFHSRPIRVDSWPS
jgi:nucleoside-diphosphate-sugar epimerase